MMMTMTMIKNDVAPTEYASISSFNFIIQSDLSAVNKCSTCSKHYHSVQCRWGARMERYSFVPVAL